MTDIAAALKLLSVTGNVLTRFQLTITFKHPDDLEESDMEMALPHNWLEQWEAIDYILSSHHFPSLVPGSAGADIVYKAVVNLDFDEVRAKNLPVPSGPVCHGIRILERMKTLRVTR